MSHVHVMEKIHSRGKAYRELERGEHFSHEDTAKVVVMLARENVEIERESANLKNNHRREDDVLPLARRERDGHGKFMSCREKNVRSFMSRRKFIVRERKRYKEMKFIFSSRGYC